MKQIHLEQINDLSSHAFLLVDFYNKLASSTAFKHKEYPRLKKLQAKDFLARTMGWASWTELSVHAKSPQTNCRAIYPFESSKAAADSISSLMGVPHDFSLNVASHLLYPVPDQEFEFVSEVCESFDISLTKLCDHNDALIGWTLSEVGEIESGQSPFDSGLNFTTRSKMNEFLQRHAKVFRAEYNSFDNVDRVFDRLLESYEKESKERSDKFHSSLSIEWRLEELVVAYLLGCRGEIKSGSDMALEFLDSMSAEYLYFLDMTPPELFGRYGDKVIAIIERRLR